MPCVVDGWEPKLFGRICRVIAGFIMLLMIDKAWNTETVLNGYYGFMIVLNMNLLQYSINLMFNKPSFGYKPQGILFLVWFGLFVFDNFNVNGYLSKLLCDLIILYSFGLIGIAYILCGILGIGGCELMAYYAIFNHFKTGNCSCDEMDCQILISPLYIFDRIEMALFS